MRFCMEIKCCTLFDIELQRFKETLLLMISFISKSHELVTYVTVHLDGDDFVTMTNVHKGWLLKLVD